MKTEPAAYDLLFGSRKIPCRLHRVDRKRLRVVVSPELTVDVYAPAGAVDEAVHAALQSKAPWIARTLDRLAAHHPLPGPRQYLSGETLLYLGRQYRLKVDRGPGGRARMEGKFLLVRLPDPGDRAAVKKVVDGWYRRRSEEVLRRILGKCHEIALRHGVPEARLVIRAMRRRWGSCSPSGRVTLNANLVLAPVHCIEYVVMHELCHLARHDHGPGFYSLLTRCQPDWRRRKETLDRFRLS